MSQEEKQEQTLEQKTAKMQHILAGHRRRRKKLGRKLKRVKARMDGALGDDPKQEKVHTRRFVFEHNQLFDELQELNGKIAWAERMLHVLDVKANTHAVVLINPLDGIAEEHSELVHRPFAALKAVKVG